MKTFIYLLVLFFTTHACQRPEQRNEVEVEEAHWEPVSNRKEEKYIAEIRPQMSSLKEEYESSESREVSRPRISGQKVDKLFLQIDDEEFPAVLEVLYLEDEAIPKATYYFQNQKLIAVEKVDAFFLFKNHKLQVWANDQWSPLKNKHAEVWLDQENYLLTNAKKYLEAFDIKFED